MPYKAGWTLGLVLLFSQLAFAQTTEQPEKIPLPVKPGSDSPIVQTMDNFRRGPFFYFEADYLHYWVNHGPAPILLTTAPNNGLNANGLTGGVLGQPGTTTLFTGRNIDYGSFSGFRGKAGVNVDADAFWAIEVGGFILPKTTVDFSRTGGQDGTPLLTIPFLDAATGRQAALDVSSQDANGNPFLTGSIRIQSDILVWGYEANVVAHSIRTGEKSVDLLVGFRALSLTESLRIDQTVIPFVEGNITIQNPIVGQGDANYFNVLANTPTFVVDQFRTRNRFFGGQVGGRFHWDYGALSADLNMQIALGSTHQQASISGSSSAAAASQINPPVLRTNLVTPGGVFALQNNSGNFSQNQFTVVPEIGLNLKYELTSQLAIRVGYSALYWSNVARPGAQIDPVLNTKLIPTGAQLPFPVGASTFAVGQEQGRPNFAFRDTAFWAHGINVGMEFRY